MQSNGKVRIGIGEDTVQFMLAIMDDVIVEGVEELVLNLFGGDVGGADVDPDNVDFEGAVTSVFILDNDGRLFYNIVVMGGGGEGRGGEGGGDGRGRIMGGDGRGRGGDGRRWEGEDYGRGWEGEGRGWEEMGGEGRGGEGMGGDGRGRIMR